MTAQTPIPENVILLDDLDLYKTFTSLMKSGKAADELGYKIALLPSGGTGFTKSKRYRIGNSDFNFLLLSPENAHPFAFLTVGQRALRNPVRSVLAVTQAQSLRRDLNPGDIALVSEARAIVYPALFQNKDPYNPADETTEVWPADPEVISHYRDSIFPIVLQKIWQHTIPTITTGYSKHPTWGGGLPPWAPEQFESLRKSGIDTFSETPTGVYEARRLYPEIEIMCANFIKGAAGQTGNPEWNRHKKKLLYPAMALIMIAIAGQLKSLEHFETSDQAKGGVAADGV